MGRGYSELRRAICIVITVWKKNTKTAQDKRAVIAKKTNLEGNQKEERGINCPYQKLGKEPGP